MNCEQTAEILPWLMNGTLDAEELRVVRSHLTTCIDCREALRQTRFVWSLQEGHLPTEVVVDYALGGLRGTDRLEMVESHLANCSRCSAELDLVRRSPQEPTATGSEDPVPTQKSPTKQPGRKEPWRAVALAATLAALLIGGGWLWSSRNIAAERDLSREQREVLETQLAALTGPRLNTPLVELLPSRTEAVLRGNVARENAPINRPDIPFQAVDVVLVLLSGEDSCGDACAIEILQGQGPPLWSAEGLRPNSAGHLTLTVPHGLLPVETFTIQVFDQSSPDRVLQYFVDPG